ncbi:hypothetical protein [Roseateles saccharophilus]|uniref:Uncharacterized protein n=1 Tax=Roseateles saccharophilus TaxID=304 RepID=A0A4R3UXB8_ROSSA|nr:hypothetical protein [Roseateles saccharophilus]MBL8277986.1 hypothetical protein [Roseateles sp.]MDG0833148.1 hypothetical protein [Roseateles saccharophilus]TCU94614.1 hypothetical protein EV671_101636 [Roseateles saccharophilus]
MFAARRIVKAWGRRIIGGFIATLLLSQLALAAYACPKLGASHAAAMQASGMAMSAAAEMASMPDCHAMPGTMDEKAPQLCRAHCSNDGSAASVPHAKDFKPSAVQLIGLAYVAAPVLIVPEAAEPGRFTLQPDERSGFPPRYLTLQVLRN